MKAAMMAGALAFALWGSAALAQDNGNDVNNNNNNENATCPGEQVLDPVTGQCAPRVYPSNPATGGAGMEQATPAPENQQNVEVNPQALPQQEQPVVVQQKKQSTADMRGLTLIAGGGVEGYTGKLAPEINPGPAWGVSAAIKPTKVLGLELGYSGASNAIQTPSNTGFSSRSDIIRNGGYAAATVGLTAAPVQPYILGGVGVSRYNVRNAQGQGFQDDTVGNVPLGLGLRTHIGHFTADARAGYNVMFNQQFATRQETTASVGGTSTTTVNGGRYDGMIRLGGTF